MGKISSVLRVNISRKHLQTFLTFYSQYHSVMIAAKLSPFLNKAPVKEHYSLTTQQQSSAGRRIRPVTTISPLANHGQDTLWLSRRTMGFSDTSPACRRQTYLACFLSVYGPTVFPADSIAMPRMHNGRNLSVCIHYWSDIADAWISPAKSRARADLGAQRW